MFFTFFIDKKVTNLPAAGRKSSLLIIFCKINEFFYPHHPDRLSQRFTCSKALWVAPSAIVFYTSFHVILKSKIHELQKKQ